MKISTDEILEEISDFLVVYLKSGRVGLNSFIKKTDLHISQIKQLLKIHFLLKSEVKQFVRELPQLIRRFKTSTTVKKDTYYGQIKGQITWPETIHERIRINPKDRTIFAVNERNREYVIKENLILLEVIQTLHSILFYEVNSEHFEKYAWFNEWGILKNVLNHLLHKNIYLSRVRTEKTNITDRMISDTLKHRNPLYRKAASILQQYRRIMAGEMDSEEVQQLLKETFVYPQEEDVLFELYWVMKLMKQNAGSAQLQILDGRNNQVAQWNDEKYLYRIYHDSNGSENIKFMISTDEVKVYEHPFINRKIESLKQAETLANEFFNYKIDTRTFWSGRPDILVEVYERKTNELKKVVIGEVKYTSRVEYATTGLRELVDYMKLIKDKNGHYLDNRIQLQGMLFTDRIDGHEGKLNDLGITEDREAIVWCVP